MIESLPCHSSGTNGMGGVGITLAIVDSSSGAASAAAMKPAIVSAVAGSSSMPPTKLGSGRRRYWKRVTTPRLPPPPRSAQNRSGCSSWLACSTCPSAVTTSAASTESMVIPNLRVR